MSVIAGIAGMLTTQGTLVGQSATTGPSAALRDRFGFTAADLTQVDAGQPVSKLLANSGRDELAVVGAVRLDGDMHRLVNWVRNIADFRKAAELGHATVLKQPISEASLASFALDPRDVAALQTCRVGACDIRLSQRALEQLDAAHAGATNTPEKIGQIVRQMLAEYANAYTSGGDAALGTYHDKKEPSAAADDFRSLLQGAVNLKVLAPELAAFLEKYPHATLSGVDQLLYLSAVSDGQDPVFTLHHLVVYPKTTGEILLADKTIYSSRSFEAAALVLSVQAADQGRGFYVTAGGRVKSAKLSGVAARVLRTRIEKEALQGVETYLAWIRDSLALPSAGAQNQP